MFYLINANRSPNSLATSAIVKGMNQGNYNNLVSNHMRIDETIKKSSKITQKYEKLDYICQLEFYLEYNLKFNFNIKQNKR